MATKKASSKKDQEEVQVIEIPPLRTEVMDLYVVGTTPLLMHKWSAKAKEQMRQSQSQKARPKKAPKNPQEDYLECVYRDEEAHTAMPSSAFKTAMIHAVRQVAGLTMVGSKGAFHLVEQWCQVVGKHEMERDTEGDLGHPVRLQSGVADLRYRALFKEWACRLLVTRNTDVITRENIANLLAVAGFACGVGDRRPSAPKNAGGNNGMWRMATRQEFEDIAKRHDAWMIRDREDALKRRKTRGISDDLVA